MTEVDFLQQLDLVERQEKVAACFESLLGRAEGLLQTTVRLAIMTDKDTDRALELVEALRKVVFEAGTQLTAKAITEALEDYQKHQGPLDHRRIPNKVLHGPSLTSLG